MKSKCIKKKLRTRQSKSLYFFVIAAQYFVLLVFHRKCSLKSSGPVNLPYTYTTVNVFFLLNNRSKCIVLLDVQL